MKHTEAWYKANRERIDREEKEWLDGAYGNKECSHVIPYEDHMAISKEMYEDPADSVETEIQIVCLVTMVLGLIACFVF